MPSLFAVEQKDDRVQRVRVFADLQASFQGDNRACVLAEILGEACCGRERRRLCVRLDVKAGDLRKIMAGDTTLEEVLRVTRED